MSGRLTVCLLCVLGCVLGAVWTTATRDSPPDDDHTPAYIFNVAMLQLSMLVRWKIVHFAK